MLRKNGDEENGGRGAEVLPIRVMKLVQQLQHDGVVATQKLASFTSKVETLERQKDGLGRQLAQAQKDIASAQQNSQEAHAEVCNTFPLPFPLMWAQLNYPRYPPTDTSKVSFSQ